MSDQGFRILSQLKQKRHKQMPKAYCQKFVQDVFDKYDYDNSGVISCSQLHQEWFGKHKRANLQHFHPKYSQIVLSITHKEHPSKFIDKMQLFEECKESYEDIRDQQWHEKHARVTPNAEEYVYDPKAKSDHSC